MKRQYVVSDDNVRKFKELPGRFLLPGNTKFHYVNVFIHIWENQFHWVSINPLRNFYD